MEIEEMPKFWDWIGGGLKLYVPAIVKLLMIVAIVPMFMVWGMSFGYDMVQGGYVQGVVIISVPLVMGAVFYLYVIYSMVEFGHMEYIEFREQQQSVLDQVLGKE